MTEQKKLPLQNLRILDLTSAVVGPYATQILADYGAEVIKLEQKSGDIIRWISGRSRTPGMSGKFMHMNRNKRSISLDLKSAQGKEALLRLVGQVDVFVHNMRTDAIAKLGLTEEALFELNPNLIYCNVVGFGSKGRYFNRPAYDSILQGGTGIASLFASSGGEPRYVPYVVIDRTAALMVVNAILVAVIDQKNSGGSRVIEVPMFESYASLLLSEHLYGETFEPPIGKSGDSRLLDPNAKPVKTKDGYICITTNTDAQVLAMFDAFGREDLKMDSRFNVAVNRIDHISEFFAIRAQEIAKQTTDYWLDILSQHDIPCMQCHTIDSLIQDPHVVDVGLIESIEHPTQGQVKSIRVPITMSNFEPELRYHSPHIGEHTVEILQELGYSGDEVQHMLSQQVAHVDAAVQKKP